MINIGIEHKNKLLIELGITGHTDVGLVGTKYTDAVYIGDEVKIIAIERNAVERMARKYCLTPQTIRFRNVLMQITLWKLEREVGMVGRA